MKLSERRQLALLVQAAALAVALLPALWMALDTLGTASSAYTAIPFWDHWATVGDFVRAKSQGLSWQILFAQSNEHRILFPRLIMFADLEFFAGRNSLPYAGILASQVALAGLFVTIALRLRNRAAALLALGPAVALIFSLGQWENLIWAFQVQFLMVAAAGAWSIWSFCEAFADRERPDYPLWATSLGLLVVSAFSMANGMMAGVACVGVGLLARFRSRALGGHAAALAAIGALYFHGYTPAADHGGLADALWQPAALATFLAAYLGNPARASGVGPSVGLGAVGFALSVAAAVRVLLGRDREPGRVALVGIIGFVVASGAVTAAGRIGLGPTQALVSRYMTFGLLFWAAQAVYWGALWPLRRPLAPAALALVMAVLVWPLFALQARSKPELAERQHQIELGVQALKAGVDDAGPLRGLNWNVPAMMEQVAYLRARRLSVFAEGDSHPLDAVLQPARTAPEGSLASSYVVQPSAEGAGWRAEGWACDVWARRVLRDLVAIDGYSRVVALGEAGVLFPPGGPAAVSYVRPVFDIYAADTADALLDFDVPFVGQESNGRSILRPVVTARECSNGRSEWGRACIRDPAFVSPRARTGAAGREKASRANTATSSAGRCFDLVAVRN